MEQFSPAEKRYTHEDLKKAEEELHIAIEHFNSFNNGAEMDIEKENEYMTRFAAAKDDYVIKAKKVRDISSILNS